MPTRAPSADCTITFGQAKLIGTALCSTTSQLAIGRQRFQHLRGQARVGAGTVRAGDVDPRMVRRGVHVHAEIGDEGHELEDRPP